MSSIKHRRVAEEYRDFKSSVGCIFQRDFRGSRGRYFIVSKRVRLVYIIFTILRVIIGIMFFIIIILSYFSLYFMRIDKISMYVCPRKLGAFLRENIPVVSCARFGLD